MNVTSLVQLSIVYVNCESAPKALLTFTGWMVVLLPQESETVNDTM